MPYVDGLRHLTYNRHMGDAWWERFKTAREAKGWGQVELVDAVRAPATSEHTFTYLNSLQSQYDD